MIAAPHHYSVVVTLWGTEIVFREFLHVDDITDACVHIMENVDFCDLRGSKKEIINIHINIGCGEDQSIKELADIVKDIVGLRAK